MRDFQHLNSNNFAHFISPKFCSLVIISSFYFNFKLTDGSNQQTWELRMLNACFLVFYSIFCQFWIYTINIVVSYFSCTFFRGYPSQKKFETFERLPINLSTYMQNFWWNIDRFSKKHRKFSREFRKTFESLTKTFKRLSMFCKL